MSDGTLPPIESVSGGSHGVVAGYAQILALAATYDAKFAEFMEMAGLGATVMANGDLVESSILSPVTFAQAEAQVLDATTGINGLTVRAIGLEADALVMRECVKAFQTADTLSYKLSEMVDHALGRVLPYTLPLLAAAGGGVYLYYQTLSPAEQDEFVRNLQNQLHEHPELVQHLINGGGGLLETLTDPLVPGPFNPLGSLSPGDGPLMQPTTNDAARLLALLFGNDTDYTVSEMHLPDDPDAKLTPGSLEDLMLQLQRTNALDAVNDENGENQLNGVIQVQRVGQPPDERFIVYVPGTDDMGPIPGNDETVRDMETNYQLIGGMDSAYGRGITDAMREAGLEGKDVMLVGHSQGGMVATALASDPEFAREFNVKHVVTAGSPTAQVPHLPGSTHAIHLENRGDAVPLLDGEDNPDQPNRTTVKFDEGDHDIAGNHGITHYANGAAAADASNHGSIRSGIRQLEHDGFLGGGPVEEVRTYRIQRGG